MWNIFENLKNSKINFIFIDVTCNCTPKKISFLFHLQNIFFFHFQQKKRNVYQCFHVFIFYLSFFLLFTLLISPKLYSIDKQINLSYNFNVSFFPLLSKLSLYIKLIHNNNKYGMHISVICRLWLLITYSLDVVIEWGGWKKMNNYTRFIDCKFLFKWASRWPCIRFKMCLKYWSVKAVCEEEILMKISSKILFFHIKLVIFFYIETKLNSFLIREFTTQKFIDIDKKIFEFLTYLCDILLIIFFLFSLN